MHGGGTNQLHTYDQFCVNAFIASVHLHQHFELLLKTSWAKNAKIKDRKVLNL
jgi:hypothetical protein